MRLVAHRDKARHGEVGGSGGGGRITGGGGGSITHDRNGVGIMRKWGWMGLIETEWDSMCTGTRG